MSHPTDAFADYVDGSLSARERKRVDEHLVGCESCRAEVAQASKARDALRALGDVDIPVGVTAPVVAEAATVVGSRARRTQPPISRRSRVRSTNPAWGKVLVAAASIAAVAAGIFIFAGTQEQSAPTSGEAAAVAPEEFLEQGADEPGRRDHDGNYNAGELQALAEDTALGYGPVTGDGDGAMPPVAEAPADPGASPTLAEGAAAQQSSGSGASRDALGGPLVGCLERIGAFDHNGTLVASLAVKYLDVPAYIVVIAEAPAAGEPQDRIVAWAIARKGCDILAFSQSRFPLATPTTPPTTFITPP